MCQADAGPYKLQAFYIIFSQSCCEGFNILVSQMGKMKFQGSERSKCIKEVVESRLHLVPPGNATVHFSQRTPSLAAGRGRKNNFLPALMTVPPPPTLHHENLFYPFSGTKYLFMQKSLGCARTHAHTSVYTRVCVKKFFTLLCNWWI